MNRIQYILLHVAILAMGCTIVFAVDNTSLNVLMDKYETGKAKIDRVAFAAYTNEVCVLMQQFKSSGDLDTFLILQNEQKALKAMPILPVGQVRSNLSAKVSGYGAMMSKLDSDRKSQLGNLQRQYMIRLDALLKELMAADRIEDAKRVKEEKDACGASIVPSSVKDVVDIKTNTLPDAVAENIDQEPEKTPKPAKIPPDAVAFKGHRYSLVKVPTTWDMAKTACEEMGGHLFIIDDDAEVRFVMSNLMADPDVYIGASFDGLRWRWLNGKPLDKDLYQLPPRADVSAGLSGHAYRGMEGRVRPLYNNSSDSQHLYICEWDDVDPVDINDKGTNAGGAHGQSGIVKPAKELLIMKATLMGSLPPVDITALLQERVADGKLEVHDFSFIPRNYQGYYMYRESYRFLMIQYKFKGGLIKTMKRKFGEPITIAD